MAFNKSQFIIKENKDNGSARFYISYQNSRTGKDSKQKSYQLLSLLKQDHDVLLEIDSTLTTLSNSKEIDDAALSLLKDFKEMGLEFRHQQFEAKSNKSLLGIFSLNKNQTGHRIFAYIPDKTWREDQFQSILPTYGIRYYICKDAADGGKLMEDLHCGRILENEKNEIFSFIIYDCSIFGQMGANTKLSKEEIQKLLTV